jgi:hypothetical protein
MPVTSIKINGVYLFAYALSASGDLLLNVSLATNTSSRSH